MTIPTRTRLPHERRTTRRIAGFWVCLGLLVWVVDRRLDLFSWQSLVFFFIGTPLVSIALGHSVAWLRRHLTNHVVSHSTELDFNDHEVLRLRLTGLAMELVPLVFVIAIASATWYLLI